MPRTERGIYYVMYLVRVQGNEKWRGRPDTHRLDGPVTLDLKSIMSDSVTNPLIGFDARTAPNTNCQTLNCTINHFKPPSPPWHWSYCSVPHRQHWLRTATFNPHPRSASISRAQWPQSTCPWATPTLLSPHALRRAKLHRYHSEPSSNLVVRCIPSPHPRNSCEKDSLLARRPTEQHFAHGW